MGKKRILVVDDEPQITELVKRTLSSAGYEVGISSSGEEALLSVETTRPDVIVMDVVMPGLSGFDVCAKLKANRQTNRIPILMLTARSSMEDIIAGIKIGADDYLTKPFSYDELIVRVEMILRRIEKERHASPLTGLPGNVSIEQEISGRIDNNEIFSVCYIDLDNFKAYNDNYSYQHGDIVISTVADIISLTVEDEGEAKDFVGHIGGDDFIIVSTPDRIEALCKRIADRFDEAAPGFYNDEDRTRGYINGMKRDGTPAVFPLLSLSLAVVSNTQRPFHSSIEVAEIAADLKKKIKMRESTPDKAGSRYLLT